MSNLFDIWHTTQARLFPWLEERLDPLSEKEQQFVKVITLMDLPKHLHEYRWCGIGRKREDREAIAKAFAAKAVYNFETTKVLIEYLKGSKNLRRLCGWRQEEMFLGVDVLPCVASIPRMPAAEDPRGHGKTHLSEKIVGHVAGMQRRLRRGRRQ